MTAWKPSILLMVSWISQVLAFTHDYDSSIQSYLKIYWRHRSHQFRSNVFNKVSVLNLWPLAFWFGLIHKYRSKYKRSLCSQRFENESRVFFGTSLIMKSTVLLSFSEKIKKTAFPKYASGLAKSRIPKKACTISAENYASCMGLQFSIETCIYRRWVKIKIHKPWAIL